MKRIVSFIVVLAVAMCGMTQVMAQKSITKEAKKVEREIKKQERLARCTSYQQPIIRIGG